MHKFLITLIKFPYSGTSVVTDLRGLNTNMFEFIVKSTNSLRSAGFSNIKLKLHPGPGRWKKKYFEAIVDRWGLSIDVIKKEPLSECIEWADIVVGPITSGSVYETLAGGKPYFASLMSPHGDDLSYFGNFPIIDDLSTLSQSIELWDWMPALNLLNDMYDMGSGSNNSRRFLEALSVTP